MGYELRCADAGAVSCGAKVSAATEEELRAKVTEHLKKHDVPVPNETVMDHLVASAKKT